MAATLEFFWELSSPYTYLAATQLDDLEQRTGAKVVWKPMLLGKVFEATGNQMPARIPAKARYMGGDLKLWAQYYGVPIVVMPKVFPINSVAGARAAIAAEAQGQGPELSLALMQAYWGEGVDLSAPDAVLAVAQRAGLDVAALAAAMQSQEVKDQLRQNTDEAVARGAFGAPTFFVGEQMFWGNDRLPLIERALTA